MSLVLFMVTLKNRLRPPSLSMWDALCPSGSEVSIAPPTSSPDPTLPSLASHKVPRHCNISAYQALIFLVDMSFFQYYPS